MTSLLTFPDDVVETICGMIDFSFLFLAPVCKRWYEFGKESKVTNFQNMMASSSTIRESGQSRGGSRVFLRRNAWTFLAKNVKDSLHFDEMADELIDIIEWDEFAVTTAGNHGNLCFFHWLRNSNLTWDPELALSSAASNGKCDFLKHMYNVGYVPGPRSCRSAALTGSVQILQWLKEVGCDVDDVTQILAEEGHVGPLIWAKKYGFPYNDKLVLDAANYGNNTVTTKGRQLR